MPSFSADRYQTAGEFQYALSTADPRQALDQGPAELAGAVRAERRRTLPAWLWAVVGVLAVSLLLVFAVAILGTRRGPEPAPTPGITATAEPQVGTTPTGPDFSSS